MMKECPECGDKPLIGYCFRCQRKVLFAKILDKRYGKHNRNFYKGKCAGCGNMVGSIRQE